jgi:cytochrome c oxidase subunit 2
MKRPTALSLVPLLAACNGVQSADGRNGSESAQIGSLFDLFLYTTLAVYLLVIVGLGIAIWCGQRHTRRGGGLQGEPAFHLEAPLRFALVCFAGATALILAMLSLATWFTDRSIARDNAGPALEIEVTGHQWWWEVRYRNPVSSRIVRTANELHLPAGRTAHVTLKSGDVIHSLWIPNLAGKQDLIPGRESDLTLHPFRAGLFRAQCAEFCGLQHAKMALDVTVEPPQAFARWYEAQLRPPPIPTSGPAFAGYMIFQTRQCASCHAVAGTPASGAVAPDLSHVASRRSLAAGTLPTNAGTLAAWTADPQAHKPGNNMPKVTLSPQELAAVTAYLETLK